MGRGPKSGRNPVGGGSWPHNTPLVGRSGGAQPLLPPPEVAQLHSPAARDTAEGCWLHIPVFDRVSKQTDACVHVLLNVRAGGAEVIDANTADFVGVKVDNLGTHICSLIVISPGFIKI